MQDVLNLDGIILVMIYIMEVILQITGPTVPNYAVKPKTSSLVVLTGHGIYQVNCAGQRISPKVTLEEFFCDSLYCC